MEVRQISPNFLLTDVQETQFLGEGVADVRSGEHTTHIGWAPSEFTHAVWEKVS